MNQAWEGFNLATDNANFDKHLKDLKKEIQLFECTPEDRVRANITQTLQSGGVTTPDAGQIQYVVSTNTRLFEKEIQAELDLVLKSSHKWRREPTSVILHRVWLWADL
jgi:hypothetical protein